MGFAKLVARWFSRKTEPSAPFPEADQRDYTRSEIAVYDGSDPSKPLLVAIRGHVYDVTRGRDFYGPGGPYGMFAGQDCTRALAKMSFDEDQLTADLDGLEPDEIERLEEWIEMFEGKYRRVGRLLER